MSTEDRPYAAVGISPEESARRREAVAKARHSSQMEGARSSDAARARQDAFVRGELTYDELLAEILKGREDR